LQKPISCNISKSYSSTHSQPLRFEQFVLRFEFDDPLLKLFTDVEAHRFSCPPASELFAGKNVMKLAIRVCDQSAGESPDCHQSRHGKTRDGFPFIGCRGITSTRRRHTESAAPRNSRRWAVKHVD